MNGHEPCPGFAELFEHRDARGDRLPRLFAGSRVPAWNVDLYRVVYDVPRENRLLIARRQCHVAVGRCVPGARFDVEFVAKLERGVDKQLLAAFDYRLNCVGDQVTMVGRWVPFPDKALELASRNHVFGILKSRHPATVEKAGIPARVIDVQVGAEYEIDVIRLHPGSSEVPQVARVHHGKERAVGAVLVIAAAGIHEDSQIGQLDDPTVYRPDKSAVFRSIVVRYHPVKVLFHQPVVPIRQERFRWEAEPVIFLDPYDLRVTDPHAFFPVPAVPVSPGHTGSSTYLYG